MPLQTNQINKTISNTIYALLSIFVLSKGALYFRDSYGFLEMNFHQSVGYNSVLKIITAIFNDNFEIPLVFIQLLMLILASQHIINTIKSIFNPNYVWLLLFQIIILSPALYSHFVANAVLSEGLAYPLFLFFVSLLLRAFIMEIKKYYYFALFVLFFLILVRGQFIAMTLVVLILVGVDVFRSRFNKENLTLIVVVVLLPFVSELVEKSFNKIVYNHFKSTPFDNVSIITAAYFVSDADDYSIFENEEEQQFFKNVYRVLDSLNLTKEKVKFDYRMYEVFHRNYSYICNYSIHDKGMLYYEAKGLNKNEQLLAVNEISGRMLFPLIKDNFKPWLKLYIDNLKNAFGSFKQLLLYLVLLIASCILLIKKKNIILQFIFATMLMVFANKMIIPIAVHSIKRYMFYTDWIIITIFILLLNEIFTKNTIVDDRG